MKKYTKYFVLLMIMMISLFYSTMQVSALESNTVTGVEVKQVSATSIKINWNRVDGAQSYYVYYSVENSSVNVRVIDTSRNYFIHNELDTGVTYHYTVSAVKNGVEQQLSKEATVTLVPDAPQMIFTKILWYSNVRIVWSEIPYAKGYYIYRRTDDSTKFEKIAETAGSVATSYIDVDAVFGHDYYYTVCAYVKRGEKRIAGERSADEIICNTKLIPPDGLTAQAKNCKTIALSWDKSEFADGYAIYRAENSNRGYVKIASVNSSDILTYMDTTAVPGVKYYYSIKSYIKVEGDLVYSDYSKKKVVSHTDFTIPEINTVNTEKLKNVDLSWTKSNGADGYYICRKEKSSNVWTTLDIVRGNAVNSYTDIDARPNKYYQYTVKAFVNVNGKEYVSAFDNDGISCSTTIPVPEIKSSDAIGARNIKLTWNSITGADGYIIFRSLKNNESWEKIAEISDGKEYYYIDNQAVPGTQYYYTMRAYVNTIDKRYLSRYVKLGIGAVTSVKTPKINNAVAVGYNSVQIKWEEIIGADGYMIYRSTKKSGNWSTLCVLSNGTATEYTDSSAEYNKQYYYTIRAYVKLNDNVYKSGYVKPGTEGKAVAVMPAIKADSLTYKSIGIKWITVGEADGYLLYRTTKSNGTGWKLLIDITDGTIDNYIDNKCTCGKKYYYKICSYKTINGKSIKSDSFKKGVGCTAIPNTPRVTAGQQYNKTTVITWDKIAGADSYYVYRKTEGSGWVKIKTVNDKNTMFYIDENADPDEIYIYTVRAVRSNIKSKYRAVKMTTYRELCNFDIDRLLKNAKEQVGMTREQLGYTDEWCSYSVSDLLQSVGVNIADEFKPCAIVINALERGLGTYYSFRDENVDSLYREVDMQGNSLTDEGASHIVNTSREEFAPQKGDIVFFLWTSQIKKYNWSHAAVVIECTDNVVYTVDGNSYSGDGVVALRARPYNEELVGVLRLDAMD